MAFENHGGPCKSGCERIACMCAHEKLARELHKRDEIIAQIHILANRYDGCDSAGNHNALRYIRQILGDAKEPSTPFTADEIDTKYD